LTAAKLGMLGEQLAEESRNAAPGGAYERMVSARAAAEVAADPDTHQIDLNAANPARIAEKDDEKASEKDSKDGKNSKDGEASEKDSKDGENSKDGEASEKDDEKASEKDSKDDEKASEKDSKDGEASEKDSKDGEASEKNSKDGEASEKDSKDGEASESEKSEVFKSDPLYTSSAFNVVTAKKWQHQGAPLNLRLGEKSADGKGRSFIILTGKQSIDELYDIGQGLGSGCIAAECVGFNAVLIYKSKEDRITAPEGCEMRATTKKGERFNMSNVKSTMTLFEGGTSVGSMEMCEASSKVLPTFNEIIAEIGLYDKEKLNSFLADAKLKQKNGDAEPLHLGALAIEKRIKEWITVHRGASEMIIFMDDYDGKIFPRDFKNAEKLKGIYFDEVTRKICEITLGQAMNSPAFLKRAIILVGRAGSGKSSLIRALAYEACERYDFNQFVFSKDTESMGLIYQRLASCGAFAFADCDMKGRGKQLSLNALKNFFDSEEEGSGIPAFWHPWSMGKYRPRFLAINARNWFKDNKMEFMQLLMDKDEKAINKLDEDKIGVVRRAIIFEVKDMLRETEGKPDYANELQAYFDKGMAKKR
jgi:hypothetical protein